MPTRLPLLAAGAALAAGLSSCRAGSDPQDRVEGRARGVLFTSLELGGRRYDYAVYLPRDHDPARSWPAILFLHGAGECGTDGSLHLTVGLPPAVLRRPERWPFVVIMPQKPTELEEWEEHAQALLAMVERAIAEHGVDPHRVNLTGLSQGGHGAWALGALAPERWASVAPLCAYVAPPVGGWERFDPARSWEDPELATHARAFAGALKDLPIRVYHGTADPVVPVRLSEVMARELAAQGNAAPLERYEGLEHNCWDRAYGDPRLAAWMLARRRGE